MTAAQYDLITHKKASHRNILIVDWLLSSVCNYSCSYCPEVLHDHKTPFPEAEMVAGFCQKVVDHFNQKIIYFQFTGGEVTLWKQFPEVLKFLSDLNAKTGINSNGSRSLSWWEKSVDYLDHVSLSFHPEQADPSHFIQVVKFLSQQTSLDCNIMMHPDHFKECQKVWEQLREIDDVGLSLQPLMRDFKYLYQTYSQEQLDFIANQYDFPRKGKLNPNRFSYRGALNTYSNGELTGDAHPNVLISENRNNWKGWKCSIGTEQIIIDLTKDVYRGWCFEGGKIGSVLNFNNLQLPTSEIICSKDFCHCTLDIACTKRKVNVPEICG